VIALVCRQTFQVLEYSAARQGAMCLRIDPPFVVRRFIAAGTDRAWARAARALLQKCGVGASRKEVL